MNFLPITKDELKKLQWDYVDVIIVTGDAYIDHPSFGAAVIGRIIEDRGLRVAILPQPNWKDDLRDFKKLGKPRLFFGVTAGNMDSMLNRYTANKRLRSDDAYTPDGKPGFRPDYATIVYSKILKQLFPDTPVIIGGIEASMRRHTHYDYWSDSLKKSILIDSEADVLVYGMGEKPIYDLLDLIDVFGVDVLLKSNSFHNKLINVNQIAFSLPVNKKPSTLKCLELHSFEQQLKDKQCFAENFKLIEQCSDKYEGMCLLEKYEENLQYVVCTKHNEPLSTDELDKIYDLPFSRLPHPKYNKKGQIPAFNMIKNSVTIHRGCFGACSFCTISAHQGKFISSRSMDSIIKEVCKISKMPNFDGTITDLGGPSANMYQMKGENLSACKKCDKKSCIYPTICNNLNFNHHPLINLYSKIEKNSNVKNVFIGSGVRFDLFFPDNNKAKEYKVLEYAEKLVSNHTGGRLKVAPEHNSEKVLKIINKPSYSKFLQFKTFFDTINKKNNTKYQLIPYFISSHPSCTIEDMVNLIIEIQKSNYHPEQVQTFTPTPMTLSTCIYYTGTDPYTKEKLYSATTIEEKKQQNLFLFWYKNENKKEIISILKKMNKPYLIKKLYRQL